MYLAIFYINLLKYVINFQVCQHSDVSSDIFGDVHAFQKVISPAEGYFNILFTND